MTTLGQAIRVGDLEVTPLKVTSGLVLLRRTITGNRVHSGGDDALKLKLRLRNVSEDSIFAPLDEGFLRERGPGPGDSLIETGDGRQIEMYPLASPASWPSSARSSASSSRANRTRPGSSAPPIRPAARPPR